MQLISFKLLYESYHGPGMCSHIYIQQVASVYAVDIHCILYHCTSTYFRLTRYVLLHQVFHTCTENTTCLIYLSSRLQVSQHAQICLHLKQPSMRRWYHSANLFNRLFSFWFL